jgi:hypothetical protein
MSEYQYYEFQAIDRPLAGADQDALRALSTRARITATSFTNSYEWGDFKGDPARLMEKWFDLHLYIGQLGLAPADAALAGASGRSDPARRLPGRG